MSSAQRSRPSLARDDETGPLGTYETAFTVPNLNREQARIPIASVVSSNGSDNVNAALYTARKGKEQTKQFSANPLVTGNRKVIPSVTRVFSKTRPLFVYLQSYTYEAASEPLIAYVSLYQGGTKLLETKKTLFGAQAHESIASQHKFGEEICKSLRNDGSESCSSLQ